KEIYSNTDGTAQFVELICANNGQEFLSNRLIRCIGPRVTNTFTYPTNLPTGTLNKSMVMGTAGYAVMPGAVTPDYVIPNNFIPLDGGIVNFGLNQDIQTYTNLSVDGVLSLGRGTNGSITNLSVLQTNSP